jgi:cytosine/adenosine deaminase-related metal-dependent hydrolase
MGHRDSGIGDLHDAGLLGPDYQATHANRLTDEELAMLRDTGGMICATAMGEFPYVMSADKGPSVHGRSRRAGVATGMGIDISLALPSDYFEHIRATYWNLYLDPEVRDVMKACSSDYILDFATALGAKSVRLGDTVGTISVGKRADLLLLSTDRIGFGMAGSLADRVVTFACTADIDSVWIAGQARKRHGKMLGVDWPALKKRLVQAQERVGRQAATIRLV